MWLGSPTTEKYLSRVLDVLRWADEQYGFTAIGGTLETTRLGLRTLAWTLDTEQYQLRQAWAGIFVQDQGAWERRKSGYKILEYIRFGAIPIAEHCQASVELLGEDYPFLVYDSRWQPTIRSCMSLRPHEHQKVIEGLQKKTARYSYEATGSRWVRFIEDLG